MGSGSGRWLRLRRYPAILAFYAAGTATVGAQRWETLRQLFERVIVANGKAELAARALAASAQLEKNDFQAVATLDEGTPTNYYTPISDRICSLLRTSLAELIPDERPFLAAFDRFEVLLSVSPTSTRPVGRRCASGAGRARCERRGSGPERAD